MNSIASQRSFSSGSRASRECSGGTGTEEGTSLTFASLSSSLSKILQSFREPLQNALSSSVVSLQFAYESILLAYYSLGLFVQVWVRFWMIVLCLLLSAAIQAVKLVLLICTRVWAEWTLLGIKNQQHKHEQGHAQDQQGRVQGQQSHAQGGGATLTTGAATTTTPLRSITVDLFGPNESRVTFEPAPPQLTETDAHRRYARSPYPGQQHANNSDGSYERGHCNESESSDSGSEQSGPSGDAGTAVRSMYAPLRATGVAIQKNVNRSKFAGLSRASTVDDVSSIGPLMNKKDKKTPSSASHRFWLPRAERNKLRGSATVAITPKQRSGGDGDGDGDGDSENDEVTPLLSQQPLLSRQLSRAQSRETAARPDTPYPGEENASCSGRSRSTSATSSSQGTTKQRSEYVPPEIHLEHYAQLPQYWTGRFVAMCDQLSNEQLEERNMDIIVSAHAASKDATFIRGNQQPGGGGMAGQQHIPASKSGPAIAQSARKTHPQQAYDAIFRSDDGSSLGDLDSDIHSSPETTTPQQHHALPCRPQQHYQVPTFAPPPGADFGMGATMGRQMKDSPAGDFVRHSGAYNNNNNDDHSDSEIIIRQSPSRIPLPVRGLTRPLPAIPLGPRRIPHSNTSGAILENAPRVCHWPLLHESPAEDRVLRLPPPLTPRRQAMHPPEYYKPGATPTIGQAYTAARPVYMSVGTAAAINNNNNNNNNNTTATTTSSSTNARTGFNFSTPRRVSAAAARVAQMNESHPHPLASNPVVLTAAQTLALANRQPPAAAARAMLLADAFNLVDDELRARRALLRVASLCATDAARHSFWRWQQDLARFTGRPSLLPLGGHMEEEEKEEKEDTTRAKAHHHHHHHHEVIAGLLPHLPAFMAPAVPKTTADEKDKDKDKDAKKKKKKKNKTAYRMSRIFGRGGGNNSNNSNNNNSNGDGNGNGDGDDDEESRQKQSKVETLARHYEGLVAATTGPGASARRRIFGALGGGGGGSGASVSAAALSGGAASSYAEAAAEGEGDLRVAKSGSSSSFFSGGGRRLFFGGGGGGGSGGGGGGGGETVRFMFASVCEHWTAERNGKGKQMFFVLQIHGPDGRSDDLVAMDHDGFWFWADVAARDLGTPGQQVTLLGLTQFDGRDARGLTKDEFLRRKGRCGWASTFIARWDLV